MAQRRVLVIDDARVIRLSVKSALKKLDIEVLELGNAEELFQSPWKFQNLDLIILDINLPGMDGISALQTLKIEPQWTSIPVIMLTGHSDPKLVRRAANFGISDYIRKPFTAEDVSRRVEFVLNATHAGPLKPPMHTYYAVIQLDSAADMPASLSDLMNPDEDSLFRPVGTLSIVFPFAFAGGLPEATTKARDYLAKKNWKVVELRVVSSHEEVSL